MTSACADALEQEPASASDDPEWGRSSGRIAAVYCDDADDITLRDLTINDIRGHRRDIGFGIYDDGGNNQSVHVYDTAITGCEVGVYVKDDDLTFESGSIEGIVQEILFGAPEGGYSSNNSSVGIWADEDSDVTVSGAEIYNHI